MKYEGLERDLCFLGKWSWMAGKNKLLLKKLREFRVNETAVKQLKTFKSLGDFCTQIIFQIIRRTQNKAFELYKMVSKLL